MFSTLALSQYMAAGAQHLYVQHTATHNYSRIVKRRSCGQLLFAILIAIIVQGCCDRSQDDVLSSVYGTLVAGNGGNGQGDDWNGGGPPADSEYITAMIGEFIVFNCHVEFPEGYPVPYIVQWDKKGVDIPIHIWYDGYPTHSGDGFEERVARVNPNSSYGLASLNLTSIRETDRGWYNCRVYFLNRSPPPQNSKNVTGSWYHLDVHAPPRFVHTSDDVVYTKVGKNIILHCRAEGTPTPELVWYKDSDPVQPSITVSIVNEGTELRISQIKNEDIGDYTCIARNGEGKIHHVVKVLIAGAAVIVTPPQNITKVEGEKAGFPCEWRAMPANATITWFRDGVPVKQLSSLESRIETSADGGLLINPVSADDSGFYECRVSNGIGETQTAVAHLNVEYPAQVTYTPTVQYLPHRLVGVVRCYIMANPPIQFVMWTRDKHLLEPYETDGFAIMVNGSLLIDRVKETHQGMYTCTPYNVHGTKGSSLQMQVIVKEPPKFEQTPEPLYQSKLGSSLELPCSAGAPNGTTNPLITWQRKDGKPLSRDRIRVIEGSLSIKNLHQSDYGEYECIASNEVATLIAPTKIIVEGTKPHAPFNITASCAVFTVTLSWLPGYAGGPHFSQNYVVWFRALGETKWETIPVTPPGSTRITVRNLSPGRTYQFQVVGINDLGEGHPSEIVNVTTKGVGDTILSPNGSGDKGGSSIRNNNVNSLTPGSGAPLPPGASTTANSDAHEHDYSVAMFPAYENGTLYVPKILKPKGPKPGAPWNVTVEGLDYSVQISWLAPVDSEVAVAYYHVFHKLLQDPDYKKLSKDPIRQTTYTTRTLQEKKNYTIRVTAYTLAGTFRESEEVIFFVPERDKQRAIIAGLVGGILFFIVAIILSVCAVKICNRRKRRKQEKAYNMVACRLTDARNGGQIPAQPQVPAAKRSGVGRVLVVTSWAKRAYRWVGRSVGLFIIHLSDHRHKHRHAIITTTKRGPHPSITSITLSQADDDPLQDTQHLRYSTSTSHLIPRLSTGAIDDSSDDGGFLAPQPLRFYSRGRRRFNVLFPGRFMPSPFYLRTDQLVPFAISSASLPRHTSSPRNSVLNPTDIDLTSAVRLPVLVQVHQHPHYLWSTPTKAKYFHPDGHPTPPPWEAERIRDILARDLDYLEKHAPPFIRYPPGPQVDPSLDDSGISKMSSLRLHDRSTSSGFLSTSKHTTTSGPSSGSIGHALRPIALPEAPSTVQRVFPSYPFHSAGHGSTTYENWPPSRVVMHQALSPAPTRSPYIFDELLDDRTLAPTVPVSEASPGARTVVDMSVDDPYEFDPIIPDTSPEITVHHQVPPIVTTMSSVSTTSRLRRPRDRYENMEARVAAMKQEFFEYRRRQKKRMESAC